MCLECRERFPTTAVSDPGMRDARAVRDARDVMHAEIAN